MPDFLTSWAIHLLFLQDASTLCILSLVLPAVLGYRNLLPGFTEKDTETLVADGPAALVERRCVIGLK